jgi:hypothetical protein
MDISVAKKLHVCSTAKEPNWKHSTKNLMIFEKYSLEIKFGNLECI